MNSKNLTIEMNSLQTIVTTEFKNLSLLYGISDTELECLT